MTDNRKPDPLTAEEEPMSARHDPWYPGGDPDAMHWVEEFDRIFPDHSPDGDVMLGWFANAIETGRLAAERARPGVSREALARVLREVAPLRYADDWPDDDPMIVGPFAIQEADAILAVLAEQKERA
jgi:hypothetical protein